MGPGGWGRASGVPLAVTSILLTAGHEGHACREQHGGELAALLPELQGQFSKLLVIVRPRVDRLPGYHLSRVGQPARPGLARLGEDIQDLEPPAAVLRSGRGRVPLV